ncbi:hypothetical protein PspLS_10975 [Pyricularia sp. CBS 133598]|nr:hypothetical protein PspLS_10975 [Pyricularia sp. CBS 133598]
MSPSRTLSASRSILRNNSLQSSHAPSSPRKKVDFVDLTEEDGDSLPTATGPSSISKGVRASRGLQPAVIRGNRAAQVNSSLPSPQSSPSVKAAATLSANKNRRSSEGVTNPILPRGLPSQTGPLKHPDTLDSYNMQPAQAQPSSSIRASSLNRDASAARISSLKQADRHSAKNETAPNVIDLTSDDEIASVQPLTDDKLPSLDDAKANASKAIRKVDWTLKNDDRLNDQLLFTEELLGWDSSASDSDSERSTRRERIRGTRYVANMSLLPKALEQSSKTGVPPIVPTTRQGRQSASTPVDRLMNDGIERGFTKDWLRSTIGRKTRSNKFPETGIDFLIARRNEKRRQEREGYERVRRRVQECDKLHLSLSLLARNYMANHPSQQHESARCPGNAGKSTELASKRKPVKVQSSTANSPPPHSPINDDSLKDWADAFSILDIDEAGRLRDSSPVSQDKLAQSPVSLQQRETEQAPSSHPLEEKTATPKGHPKKPIQQQQHQSSPDEISSSIDVNESKPAVAEEIALPPNPVKIESEPGQQSYTGITDDKLIALKREHFDESSSDKEDAHPPSHTLSRGASPQEAPSRSSMVYIKGEATSHKDVSDTTVANTRATILTASKHPVLAPRDTGTPASSKKVSKKKLAKLPSAPQLTSNPSPSTSRRGDLGDDAQDVSRPSIQQSGAQTDQRLSPASKKRKSAEDAEDRPQKSKKPRTVPTANADNTKSDNNHQGGMASTATSADLREKKALKNRRARLKKKARKERQREEEARAAAIIAKKGVKDEQKKEIKDEQKKPDGKAPATTPPKTKKNKKKNKNTPVAKSASKVLSGRANGRNKQK